MKHDKHYYLRLLGFGMIALAASTAASAEDTLVAQCGGSNGANFFLSEVTPAEASIVYELPPAPGDGAVLVIKGSDAHWSTDTRSAIDKACGGDGSDEISLFTPIQPRDGTWSIAITDHRMVGCSPMIAGAAKKAVTNALGDAKTHQLSFQQPFHPEPLMAKAEKDFAWVQTGADTWQSQIMQKGGDSGAMTMDVMLVAEVVSPTQIDETSTFTIRMSPQLQKIMGGTGNCRSIADYTLTWVK